MAEALAKKLQLRPGQRLLLINAPDELRPKLEDVPADVEVSDQQGEGFDAVHLFVKRKSDVDALAPTAISSLKERGLLWISYPKRSSKVETDITRDVGWEAMTQAGWRPVTQISIDDTWSALRFRPLSEVGT